LARQSRANNSQKSNWYFISILLPKVRNNSRSLIA
jgi:hypothetical protein